MEITYTVENRPDTGIYNAKLGIWLFLASEVMLFGGLFSAYVLLRVGAEPGMWPHGWLDVKLGTINTIILALSAITTLLAWAACKVRQFGKFKIFHACTIALGLSFLCLHMYEYHDEWMHYEIQLTNGKIADGHLVERSKDFDLAKKTGTVTLEGRIVEERKELMDLRTPEARAAKESEVTVAAADIKNMENYSPRHNTFTAIYFTITGLHGLHVLGGTLVIFYLWGPGSRMWKTDPERFTNRIEVSGLFWHFVDLVWIFLFPVLYLT
jgi:cytochrome c oxidase subunit 3